MTNTRHNYPGLRDGRGPGREPVGSIGIFALSLYLIAVTGFLAYTLACFWIPTPAMSNATPPPVAIDMPATAASSSLATLNASTTNTVEVRYLGLKPLQLSYEVVLLIVVATCGSLGAMVHALRSLSWYIGNRELRRSWVAKYVMQPFVGATISLIFYFVVRAGFLSAQATVQSTNLLGFAAMAGLVGLFSEQAVLKLKDVADTLFTKPKAGGDAVPQDASVQLTDDEETSSKPAPPSQEAHRSAPSDSV